MFFVTYGVSIMNSAFDKLLVIVVILCLVLAAACGKQGETPDTSAGGAGETASLTEEEIIGEVLNEAIIRLKYGDKTGLYENEFEYMKDEYTYDDYLRMAQIRWAEADSITFVEVRRIEFFDRDSAQVDVTVHFEGPTGQKSYVRDKVVVYYHQGRWIKPTVSVIDQQLYYDEKIRVADSAAAAEEELY